MNITRAAPGGHPHPLPPPGRPLAAYCTPACSQLARKPSTGLVDRCPNCTPPRQAVAIGMWVGEADTSAAGVSVGDTACMRCIVGRQYPGRLGTTIFGCLQVWGMQEDGCIPPTAAVPCSLRSPAAGALLASLTAPSAGSLFGYSGWLVPWCQLALGYGVWFTFVYCRETSACMSHLTDRVRVILMSGFWSFAAGFDRFRNFQDFSQRFMRNFEFVCFFV